MIIVSQDEFKIVNFNNLTQIYLTYCEDTSSWFIRFETVDSLYDDLGNYKTEEKAKQVLKEIKWNWETRRELAYYMPKEQTYEI